MVSSEAKAEAIKRIKLSCGGLLIDTPMMQGGTSNTGPVARRFFHPSNREAICNLIPDRDDRENLAILLD